jgi:ribosomal protein S18 acetylase RimI-like enzyme
MDYRVVPIAECHIRGFHASLDEVARERRFLAFLEVPPLAETESFVRKNIEKRNAQFVAVADERVIGWCDATPSERPVFAHRATLGMGVLAPFRGQGVGRKLIDATLAAARLKGAQRIDLEVREDNVPAMALYRAVGFVIEGVKVNAYRLDDKYFNLVSMALWFNAIA